MPRFAANISMLFTERPFPERFAAARAAGFPAVECLFPYAWPADQVHRWLHDNELSLVLFNLPPGDWEAGERGLAGLPGREAEFRQGVARALDYAQRLDCPRLHCMAGIPGPRVARARALDTLVENVRYAADRLAARGRVLTLEPINSRLDMPGYLIDTPAQALAVIDAVGRPNVRLQYDLYHAAVMGESLFASLRECFPRLEHVQFADVPGRHEPGSGMLPLAALFEHLDALGYRGWVSAEYRPAGVTEAGLGWLPANLQGAPGSFPTTS